MKPRQADKHLAKEAERQAMEQARKKASYDREHAIEETERIGEAKRAEKRLAEEPEQLAKEQARKEAWLARERAIEEAQKARKTKESKKLEGK